MSVKVQILLLLPLVGWLYSIPDEPGAIFVFADGEIQRNVDAGFAYKMSRVNIEDRIITNLIGLPDCVESTYNVQGLTTSSEDFRCMGIQSNDATLMKSEDMGAHVLFAKILSTADEEYYPIFSKTYEADGPTLYTRIILSQKVSVGETEFKLEFMDSENLFYDEMDVDTTFTATIPDEALGWCVYGFTFTSTHRATLYVAINNSLQVHEVTFDLGTKKFEDNYTFMLSIGCDTKAQTCIDAEFKKLMTFPGAFMSSAAHFKSLFVCKQCQTDLKIVKVECPDCYGNSFNLCEDIHTCIENNPSVCGNGVIEVTESCDDGNTVTDDGCDSSCQIQGGYYVNNSNPSQVYSLCGDGILSTVAGEECDDQNTNSGDGCDSSCKTETLPEEEEEPVEEGPPPPPPPPDEEEEEEEHVFDDPIPDDDYEGAWVLPGCEHYNTVLQCPTCGNLNYQPDKGEECDPKEEKNYGGCSESCYINSGYECTGSGTNQACFAICGDGQIIDGTYEECDDGNTVNGDGCSCVSKSNKTDAIRSTLDDGWECPNEGQPCEPECEDGQTVGDEVCDSSGGDGCNNCMEVELGWTCPSGGGSCSNICGDGILVGNEQCDDGNTQNGDGCRSNCNEDTGYDCDNSSMPSQCLEVCGDGKIVGRETCDDGNTDFWDGCAGNCLFNDPGYTCATPGQSCYPTCGDGVTITPAEECDDGNNGNKDGCSSDCEWEEGFDCSGGFPCPHICGDRLIIFPNIEECDVVGSLGCINCVVQAGWECDSVDSCWESCGDGTIDSGEDCDDSNNENGDGCNSNCEVEQYWSCLPTKKTCHVICGDGKILEDEVCDDGNTDNGDGCKGDCSGVEAGYECLTEGEDCTIVCGDGLILSPEICDDGGNEDGDGCMNDCSAVEAGWECPYPDPCFVVHGDGLITHTEVCDDGNAIEEDGCSIDCMNLNEINYVCVNDPLVVPNTSCVPRCGDGIVKGDEECDDGNSVNLDGCSTECKWDRFFIDVNIEFTELNKDTFVVKLVYDMEELINIREGITGIRFDSLPPEDQDFDIERMGFEVVTPYTGTPPEIKITKSIFDREQFVFTWESADTFWGDESIYFLTLDLFKMDDNYEIYGVNQGSTMERFFEMNLQMSAEVDAMTKQAADVASYAIPAVGAGVVTAAVLGFASVHPFYAAVNACQLVQMTPLMTTFVPQEGVQFLNGLSIANLNSSAMQKNFDLLGGAALAAADQFKRRLFGRGLQIVEANEDEEAKKPVDWRYEREDVPCKNLFCNGGDILFFWVVLIILVIINMLVVLLTFGKSGCCCQFIHRTSFKYHLQTRWNMWLRGTFESMLMLGLTASINIQSGTPGSVQYYFSWGILGIIGYVYLFVWWFVIFRRKQIYNRERQYVVRYGVLFTELKTSCFWDLLHYPFFMTRRIIFVAVLIFLKSWPRTQCGILFTLCLATLTYLAYYRPFIRRHILAINIINEMFITLVCLLSFYFISPKSGMTNKVLGYILIGLVVAMLAVNLISIILNVIINFFQWRREKARNVPRKFYGQTKPGFGSLADTTNMCYTGAPEQSFDSEDIERMNPEVDVKHQSMNMITSDSLMGLSPIKTSQDKFSGKAKKNPKHFDGDDMSQDINIPTAVPTFKNQDFVEY